MVKVTSKRMRQDETGQWWYDAPYYKYGVRCVIRTCAICGEEFVQNPYHNKQPTCSQSCGLKYSEKNGKRYLRGPDSPRWKGGKLNERGYVSVLDPEMSLKPDYRNPNGKGTRRRYVREHRLVMEQMLGRKLYRDEIVHHKNGIRDDNRPENLELWHKGHPGGARVGEREEKHCPTCTCFDHEG